MKNTLIGFFILFLSFFMIITSIKNPLSADEHIYIEDEIINLETHSGTKRRTYQTFNIKKTNYKGTVFSNYPLFQISISGTKIMTHFKENEIIGFHIDKSTLNDRKINIYSLKAKGKIIVPLERKWIFKYSNLGIGIFLLFGSFLLFKDG